ncbi:MAG: hypothetical protein KC589_05260 [Nanoarchaeota archaeon]|nr:hypothetical protein [Nanoarchaeota archaeon]
MVKDNENVSVLEEMNDSKKLEQILKNQIKFDNTIKNKPMRRVGLYFMLGITMFASTCTGPSNSDVEEVQRSNYVICLNQQKIQEQLSELYKQITGKDYFENNYLVEKINCLELEIK